MTLMRVKWSKIFFEEPSVKLGWLNFAGGFEFDDLGSPLNWYFIQIEQTG